MFAYAGIGSSPDGRTAIHRFNPPIHPLQSRLSSGLGSQKEDVPVIDPDCVEQVLEIGR
jgi:hypothetical protein